MSELNSPSGPVILDITGTRLSQEDKDLLGHPQVGGVILFRRNYEDRAQLCTLVREIRARRPSLLLCVDHEGGRVQRFQHEFTVLPAMQSLGNLYNTSADEAQIYARELGWLMAVELLVCDVDMSFAPVLDVDDHVSDIIGDRAFSADPQIVTSLAACFIDGMHEAGMAATGKHFPGHGGVVADSHLELPVDDRDMAALLQRDLSPFRNLVRSLDAVMSAHILFPRVDGELVSYSSRWLRDQLRGDLGFEGLIFSDDLAMAGAAGVGTFTQRAQKAFTAGCDVVLVCNHRAGAVEILESLEKQKHLPPGRRQLTSLRKRKRWHTDDVFTTGRWKKAVHIAKDLTGPSGV